jgi:hypothetical protein
MKNKISLMNFWKKTKYSSIDKKIKIMFNELTKNKKYGLLVIEKYLNNLKNNININKIKINYNYINTIKTLKCEKKEYKTCFFCIVLLKKQTYINVIINNKKYIHNTNGIVLKKNGILEKCRKKDSKSSIMNLNNSINLFKNIKISTTTIVNIKKIKPFLNKIIKVLKNEINLNNLKFILSPEISFFKSNFKKIKSIKRRLRKKYTLLDV